MDIPLLDLKKQYQKIRDEVMLTVGTVFESQRFILGPKVEELEERIAEYCGSKYAVGVSSGTDALLISLMCAGVGAGDLVATTPYTFFGTAGSIARIGAEPVFIDIDERTYNIDAQKLAEKIAQLDKGQRSRLKAVMPVHLYGQCADMEPILKIAAEHDLVVIEDAAQAIGAEYEFSDGSVRRAGSMGHYGCFSFFPSKNLGAFGDGGMVATSDDVLYDRLRILRVHGAKPKYYHQLIGGNFRLDALQAAILLVKLKYLDEWTESRIKNANIYRKLFGDHGLTDFILPFEKEKRHIYNQFVIKVADKRDELKRFLNDNKIGNEIYYPIPLHIQECFRYLGNEADAYPVSVEASLKTLALPIYPELARDQIKYIVDTIKKFKNLK